MVKQKPQPSQCIHHKNTFLSHCPQVQGGQKRFNRCDIFLCVAELPLGGTTTASSYAYDVAPSVLDCGPHCFTPFLWVFFEEECFCGSARAATKRSARPNLKGRRAINSQEYWVGTLKRGIFTMCHKRDMAYIPYGGQVQSSALTGWIGMKATKSFHCNDLPFSIFRNVLFHDATVETSTRGEIFMCEPLSKIFRLTFVVSALTNRRRRRRLNC